MTGGGRRATDRSAAAMTRKRGKRRKRRKRRKRKRSRIQMMMRKIDWRKRGKRGKSKERRKRRKKRTGQIQSNEMIQRDVYQGEKHQNSNL